MDLLNVLSFADQTFQIFVSEEILLKMIQTTNQKDNVINRLVVLLDYVSILTKVSNDHYRLPLH